ncbi:MAG: polyphenol oxidase family protein [Spirochaetes bacterium]|nr:polyphenol oxidase family protein [Spirochaetota bacterium]
MRHLEFKEKQNHLLYIDMPDMPCAIGIAGKNCNTVNYELNLQKIRKFEKFLIHFETGIAPEQIFFLNQKHEDRIFKADSPVEQNNLFCADADAMITDKKQFCLVIRTADCVPVMIVDPIQNCIGAVHSGWRSTEKDITGKCITKMKEEYGSNPSDLKVFLLPGIDADDYEVNKEVAEKFPGHYIRKDDRFFLNLKSSIRNSLLKCGINEDNIFNSFQGTYNFNEIFFSHRKDDAGRNLNYIFLK